jgi:hypothetical protein
MDVAIALGQGVGLAVACGLVALLPIAVGSLGAVAGILPGALNIYDETAMLVGSLVAGGANAVAEPKIAGRTRIVLAAIAGAVVCELAAGDEISYVSLAVGALVGGAAGWVATRIVDPANKSGPGAGVTLFVVLAGIVAAAIALIPFAGYVLLLVAAWFGRRARKVQDRKYAGLRVLR